MILAAFIADHVVRCHLKTMARMNVGYDLLTWEGDILRLKFWAQAFEVLATGTEPADVAAQALRDLLAADLSGDSWRLQVAYEYRAPLHPAGPANTAENGWDPENNVVEIMGVPRSASTSGASIAFPRGLERTAVVWRV